MRIRVHWRKAAKVCPQCHKLKSAGSFICELESCVECSFDNAIWREYKKCTYCCKFLKAEYVPKTICKNCLQFQRQRHHEFKKSPKLMRGEHYVCGRCNVSKSSYSYARGTPPDRPICKSCVTIERIDKEGKFRCKGCCSVFPKEEIYWNKHCLRCYEKNKAWNVEKQRQYRKDPKWKEYYRQCSRYYWHCVVKPIYNKTLALQWIHGYAKKRRVNRNGYWYMLNHSLFEDFKKRPKYWYAITSQAIETMQKGKDVSERLERLGRLNGWRPPPPMF